MVSAVQYDDETLEIIIKETERIIADLESRLNAQRHHLGVLQDLKAKRQIEKEKGEK